MLYERVVWQSMRKLRVNALVIPNLDRIMMTAIFDNAIDSLKVGISHYLIRDEHETADKHAILMIYHSIELFLKEKLAQIHPILIYTNINKAIHDDSPTVGLKELLVRYRNLSIGLSQDEIDTLQDLQSRRNRIEHHKYERSEKDSHTIGMALKFLHEFFPSHFGCTLEDHLDSKMYAQVRDTIFKYQELLEAAIREVEKYRPARLKDELCDKWLVRCPDCYENTLVLETERGIFCFLCNEEKSVEECPRCGEYVDSCEFDDLAICGNCFDSLVNNDNT